jgi:phosphoesterase RecJ-like protein
MASSIEQLTAAVPVDVSTGELTNEWANFHAAVMKADRILLSTHENPDGDGLGAQLALCEHFKMLGKDCRILNCSLMPPVYNFLDPNGWIEVFEEEKDIEWLKSCDLAIAFDLGDFRRLRFVGDNLVSHKIPLACIDHHPQKGYDAINGSPYQYHLIDFTSPSTGTLIWQYLRSYRSEKLTSTMAEALYTALVTDTGSFIYDNTDARAHLMAMDLMDAGVYPYNIHKRVYEQRTHAQLLLLGTLIQNIKFASHRRVGWCVLTQELFSEAHADLEDVEGFSEFIRAIKEVEVSALIVEEERGKTRISLRSKGSLAINDVAEMMGGGGHAYAAGASLERDWEDVESQLIPLLKAKVADLKEEDSL